MYPRTWLTFKVKGTGRVDRCSFSHRSSLTLEVKSPPHLKQRPLKEPVWDKQRPTSGLQNIQSSTTRSVRSSLPLAFSVWGHLWRLSPWAGVAAMTYSANLKGYSIPYSLRPCRLWCHMSFIWHLSTFRTQRRDWIVLYATHLCVYQAGLIAFWSHFSLLFFSFLFFSKQGEFHIERSLPNSSGCERHHFTLVVNAASMQFCAVTLSLMEMEVQSRQPAKVSPRRWEAALMAQGQLHQMMP